jgi:16S rRNA (cytosine1402-N4)-methyltransferase
MGEDRVAHVTVLAEEVCAALRPVLAPQAGANAGERAPDGACDGVVEPSAPRVLVDATAGLGGHTAAVLATARPTRVVLLDRDAAALERARARLGDAPCPIDFVHAGFAGLGDVLARLGLREVAAIVADLGVSSMQLDEPERGFSFRADGPLDMRMDPSRGTTAAELLAQIDVERLTRILREHGEEPEAGRIAAAIVKARPTTTRGLAEVVTEAISGRARRKLAGRIHPATRTFMALRIEVNDELGQLDRFLADAPSLLVVGGRLAVITFHSLEDRRVKRRFRALGRPPEPPAHLPLLERDLPRPRFRVPHGYAGGVTDGEVEIEANPRARSARLRVLERCAP